MKTPIYIKTLDNILSQFGCISRSQLKELGKHSGFSHLKVVIKWVGMPREQLYIRQAINRIKEVEVNKNDHCREVSFLTQDLPMLTKGLATLKSWNT